MRTFQRIPKLVDKAFEDRGGKRLVERGEGDAGDGMFFEAFDTWAAKLWEVLPKVRFVPGRYFKSFNQVVSQEYSTEISKDVQTGLEMKVVSEGTTRASDLRQQDAALGTVVENKVLTAPGAPEKRHIGTPSRG